MKILYHHRTFGDGAEGIHIREMVDAFRELGHDVEVVSLIGGDQAKTGEFNSKTKDWSKFTKLVPGSAYELAELAYNPIAMRKIKRVARHFRPDVIYDRYNSYSTAAVKLAPRLGVPVVLEVNAPVAHERVEYSKNRLRFAQLAQRYERSIFAQADHIYVVSSPLQEFLYKERNVPLEKMTVLPNGATRESFILIETEAGFVKSSGLVTAR